jgi:hypothetical protein
MSTHKEGASIMVDVLMPYGEPSAGPAGRIAPRLPSLDGQTIGVVNNSWRCMHVVAEELTRRLKAEHGVVEIIERRISAAQTLPPPMLEEMAGACDAVIVGIGN